MERAGRDIDGNGALCTTQASLALVWVIEVAYKDVRTLCADQDIQENGRARV